MTTTTRSSRTAPKVVEHPSAAERAQRGREARSRVPRSAHAEWTPGPERQSPVAVLEQQAASRVPELVPLRHARMAASPFAFYRGAAAIMAGDLASTPDSGLRVQCCGDAHLANFGGFAAPDRTMVFDINDFDETHPGPWEWDVKRLAASFEIAARAGGFDDDVRAATVEATVQSYRMAMRQYATWGNLELWYARADEASVTEFIESRIGPTALKRFRKNLEKARAKDSLRARDKLTTQVDGEYRIASDPPLLMRLDELVPDAEAGEITEVLRRWLRGYRESLQPSLRLLLESFEVIDVARKVVGVGSVGTRCWITYLHGRDTDDPLFLQIKEAEASVLEPYLRKSTYGNHGRRVVEGQRLTQSASDIFLGWDRATDQAGTARDFYVRQLWDGKMSPQIDIMEPELLETFGELCGSTLARAHARSGDRVAIASYLGSGPAFDRAITTFAALYADQNDRDHDAVVRAIRSGRLEAEDVPPSS
jgi:uncharacterized protein (DUF2252 family)